MISFKQYINEGLRKAQRVYASGIRASGREDAERSAFNAIMDSSPEERIKSALNDRQQQSTKLFNIGDKQVLKMMSRAARKPEGTDITPIVKNIHTALRTGTDNPLNNMGSKMRKIRSSVDLMRAGDRGEYGTLIPEI